MAVSVLQNEEKFLKYIIEKKWWAQMHTLNAKLLRTTELDEGNEENEDDENRILKPLLDSFI